MVGFVVLMGFAVAFLAIACWRKDRFGGRR